MGAAPAPPKQVTLTEFISNLRAEVTRYENRIVELLKEIDGCVGERTRTCGLPANDVRCALVTTPRFAALTNPAHAQAPDPWTALDGQKCQGYTTKSTRPYDYCAYWDVEVSPNAATAEHQKKLLEIGPVCKSEFNAILPCSSNSTRTQRAGVYELAYWLRPDRDLCGSQFFRSRITPEFTTEQGCRAEILRRNTSCYLECDVCKAQCTSPLARALVNTWKCSAGLPVGGINAAVRVSDQGNDMVKRHGANVNNGGVPTPDEIYPEIHETLINNDVTYPRVIRNSVSCRKAHRESIYGRFTPGLDDEGKPIHRKGFMVPCQTDADCHSRCGEHPIHGDSYVCVKNANFYDWYAAPAL